MAAAGSGSSTPKKVKGVGVSCYGFRQLPDHVIRDNMALSAVVSAHVVPGLKMAAVGSSGSLESAPRIMRLVAECSRSGARAGELRLPHGTVATPVFMPVGTQATMKGITAEQLDTLGCRICLGNTYHLGLRPVCGFDLGWAARGPPSRDMPLEKSAEQRAVLGLTQAWQWGCGLPPNFLPITGSGADPESPGSSRLHELAPQSADGELGLPPSGSAWR